MTVPVITIDGPSGAGKGTVARCIALELGFHLLDSGAIYRILGLAATDNRVAFDDIPSLVELANSLELSFPYRQESHGCRAQWCVGGPEAEDSNGCGCR